MPSLSTRLAGGLLAVALLASCGGDGGDSKDASSTRSEKGESGLEDAGDPVRGGRIVYGLEAESAGGWCLPESQLAISGNTVRRAIYDSLVMIDEDSVAAPHLAKSITPNGEYTVWTITLREGVKFHDGTTLDATVVKNNLDAYRGAYPARQPRLTVFTLGDVDAVEVVDPLTVEVTTKVPWVNFPYSLQIMGIMAQAQLDDPETCKSNLIGTGPFKLASWVPDRQLVAQRNGDYWQIAPDGKPYPYADAIEFRPIPESQQRTNALEAGDIDLMVTASGADLNGSLATLRDSGEINLIVSEDHAEVNYLMLNSSKPPFNDRNLRRAVAMGLDRDKVNEVANDGFPTVAHQPFPPGDMGYVEDPGFPEYNPDEARKLVEAFKAGGGDTTITVKVQSDPISLLRIEEIQHQLAEVGVDLRIATVEQTTLVSDAIAGDYQAMVFRQHPGGEPDYQYIWWYSENNPMNFSRVDDPVIDQALDAGRQEPDPAKRQAIYEEVSRQFGEEVWNVWLNYVPWAVGLAPDVHGVLNVELPDGGKPSTGLADGHPLAGLWKADG